MILAAGVSPAWQQVLPFEHFLPGQVNRAREAYWYGSGKALNVAVALQRLGGPVKVISPLGGLATSAIEAEFDEADIPARWIGTQRDTRICTTILDEATGVTTELVENAPPLEPHELAEFYREYAVDAVKSRYVVLTGSIPAGTPETFYRELLAATPCPAILDVRGPELLCALERRPLLVKPNREELAHTLGRALPDERSLLEGLWQLRDQGAQWVLVSDGPGPVWVSGPDGNYRFHPVAVSHIVNPIGCGDCLAAGIAWALREGQAMLAAIRFGLGCAAANLGNLLAARIDRPTAETFAKQIQFEIVT